jgi:hypothetical protein
VKLPADCACEELSQLQIERLGDHAPEVVVEGVGVVDDLASRFLLGSSLVPTR